MVPLVLVRGVLAVGAAGLAVAAESALRRRRPSTRYGRYADWVHPGGPSALPANMLANSRLARALCEPLPVAAMASTIVDVVYVNYLAPAHELAPLVPRGLEIQRVGAEHDRAVLSFLTYRHGHLGPARLERFRRFLPSPVQSNWRVYVTDPRTGRRGVYFVSTAVNQIAYALGGRLLCEGLPMHLLRQASVGTRDGGRRVDLHLDPGTGSGPDADGEFLVADTPGTGPWRPAFASYPQMLAYVVPQDRALSVQPWHHRVTRQEITVDISSEGCVPLVGAVRSRYAQALVGDLEPFSFLVRHVDFRFDREVREPDR